MAGIYLHIPFCRQKCSYCNFHFSVSLKTKDDFVKAILKEIEINHNYLKHKNLDSIYFGGGTPSILSSKEIDLILTKINKYFGFNRDIEITLEANPDDVDRQYLADLKNAGINRFSLGVQSFHDKELKILNRSHNASKAIESILLIKEVGFDNTNIDLIFGIPESSFDEWKRNLDIFLRLDIPHLSCYNLTIEPRTILAHHIKTGKISEINDILNSQMFEYTHHLLTKNHFFHYEISNFAIAGKHAVHNTNYWKGVPYLGLGPAAHSYNGKTRQWNISNNRKYIEAINMNKLPATVEKLSFDDKYNEYIMTGLRTMWGVEENKIKHFGDKYQKYFEKKVLRYIQNRMVYKRNTNYILSEKGLLFADRIASDLFFT